MIKTLRAQVEHILDKHPKARDSDQWLTIKLWTVFYPSRIQDSDKGKFIYLRDVMELPREDNIKRVRAIIQNVENRFLPTNIEVVRKRKINEEVWKEYILLNSVLLVKE